MKGTYQGRASKCKLLNSNKNKKIVGRHWTDRFAVSQSWTQMRILHKITRVQGIKHAACLIRKAGGSMERGESIASSSKYSIKETWQQCSCNCTDISIGTCVLRVTATKKLTDCKEICVSPFPDVSQPIAVLLQMPCYYIMITTITQQFSP